METLQLQHQNLYILIGRITTFRVYRALQSTQGLYTKRRSVGDKVLYINQHILQSSYSTTNWTTIGISVILIHLKHAKLATTFTMMSLGKDIYHDVTQTTFTMMSFKRHLPWCHLLIWKLSKSMTTRDHDIYQNTNIRERHCSKYYVHDNSRCTC